MNVRPVSGMILAFFINNNLRSAKMKYKDNYLNQYLDKFDLPDYIEEILNNSPNVILPMSRSELITLATASQDFFDVEYEVEGLGIVKEANVTRCKNGVSINYYDDYMRRRDPDCLIIGDTKDTDKPTYSEIYKKDFSELREDTFKWLMKQELILMPFKAGGTEYGYDAILIAPANAGFFAGGLGDLQGFVSFKDIKTEFKPKAVIYLAPPFRHSYFDGKQRVIHNRLDDIHELFSYNLYPGPSAKKGVYGVLLNIGEKEGWVTAHTSTVKVLTPYDNEIVIMHEGASGGGKSEMIENIHREMNGRIKLGENTVTGEIYFLDLKETCDLRPITDDMAICHPNLQKNSRRLVLKDAEQAWFLRLDHIKSYGTSPHYEKVFIHPSEPLIFLNLQGGINSTCLPWEHTLDSDGTPCPNPRVILPRRLVTNVIDSPVKVDVRSFGVRTPPCTKENPSYGIMGMMHILPPAIAWLWRLVAPRGHNNPSITGSYGLSSEGVGSYWPFATGKLVDQANLLLKQFLDSYNTRYVLIPNQHIGAYEVGFMPQWISREYLARRGSARFNIEQLIKARCTMLGYCLDSLKVDGQYLRKTFLQPELQSEVGVEGYNEGAKILNDFFHQELEKFNTDELHPVGRKIIDLFNNNASLEEYIKIIPMKY